MKIKISEVMRKDNPFDLKKGGKGYPYAVKLEGSDTAVKVLTFTDKLVVEPGAVFESGVNCGDIKKEEKDNYQAEGTHTQYTIFAKKSEGGSWKGGSGFKKVSMSDYEFAINWCKAKDKENWLTILDIMMDHVEIETPKDTADKVKDEFDNPFDKSDVPF